MQCNDIQIFDKWVQVKFSGPTQPLTFAVGSTTNMNFLPEI